MLSIDELDERIELLEREIDRLREARASKEDSRAAASAFFKIGPRPDVACAIAGQIPTVGWPA